jgi:hypothetical protein
VWGGIEPGTQTLPSDAALFPRIDAAAE